MRNFVAACAVACAANAFEWAAFKESLPFTWYDTKYELRQAQIAKGVNYDLKLRENHADRAHQARMQNAEMHQRLGLTNHLYGQDTNIAEEEDGIQAAVLNVLIGMSFDGTANNSCFESMENLLVSIDSSGKILRKLYIPENLANLQIEFQNGIVLSSDMYVTCALSSFFYTLTGLFTSEGLTELQGRAISAYPFQFRDAERAWRNPEEFPLAERYQRYGKLIALLCDYYL